MSGNYQLCLPPDIETQIQEYQQGFIPEDTDEAAILGFLEQCSENYVCTKMLYYEALNHTTYEVPKRWEINSINEIMATSAGDWKPGPQHRFREYGQQRSWVRKTPLKDNGFITIPASMEAEMPFR